MDRQLKMKAPSDANNMGSQRDTNNVTILASKMLVGRRRSNLIKAKGKEYTPISS
jgi:hypothetical protein